MNARTSRTVEWIIAAVTALVLVGIFVFYKYRKRLLKNDGVFVIGEVKKVKEVENGYNATIVYRFKNKEYTTGQKTLPAINQDLVFLMISQSKPTICSLIQGSKVPPCLRRGDYFDSSWKAVPICY